MSQTATEGKGSNRVIRGGNWNNDASNTRVANRNNTDPSNRKDNLGFRLSSSRPSLSGAPASWVSITVVTPAPGS